MSFRNILIVDANVDAARQLSRTLNALGYHVEVAGNAGAACSLARATHFDVGIFSESLPDSDGASLYAQIAELQQGIRGILLAAAGNLTTVWKAISAGMQRVVTRPIDFRDLLPVVEAPATRESLNCSEACAASLYDETTISRLSSDEIRFRLSRDELIGIIQSVDYPFAGKDRLPGFDRDTLERVVHLVRRWCQSRQPTRVSSEAES